MERIDSYFKKDSNLTCNVGVFPEKHSSDYCWGGCPGALQEAMHIFKGYYPNVNTEIKKVRYIVGNVNEPLDLDPDEKVIFAGDCTRWQGTINGKDVNIESSYKTPAEVNEQNTKSNDMLLKTWKTLWTCFKQKNSQYIHAKGCPVSVGDHVHYLSAIGKVNNINFDPRMLIPLNIAYWKMRTYRLLNRFIGK